MRKLELKLWEYIDRAHHLLMNSRSTQELYVDNVDRKMSTKKSMVLLKMPILLQYLLIGDIYVSMLEETTDLLIAVELFSFTRASVTFLAGPCSASFIIFSSNSSFLENKSVDQYSSSFAKYQRGDRKQTLLLFRGMSFFKKRIKSYMTKINKKLNVQLVHYISCYSNFGTVTPNLLTLIEDLIQ